MPFTFDFSDVEKVLDKYVKTLKRCRTILKAVNNDYVSGHNHGVKNSVFKRKNKALESAVLITKRFNFQVKQYLCKDNCKNPMEIVSDIHRCKLYLILGG